MMDSIRNMPGIGPKTAQKLENLNIYSTEDLLHYFPYKYEYIAETSLLEEKIISKAIVLNKSKVTRIRKNLDFFYMDLNIQESIVRAVIYNRGFLHTNLKIGDEYIVSGSFKNRDLVIVEMEKYRKMPYIKVRYSANKDLKEFQIKRYIDIALNHYLFNIESFIPEHLQKKYQLLDYQEAIYLAHHPKTKVDIKNSLRTLKYYEAYQFFQKLEQLDQKKLRSKKREISLDYINKVEKKLPFLLTTDQKKTLEEIIEDFQSPYVMNRLVHGDVGSGKTIVSIMATALNASANLQTAIMSPTEVLAKQTFKQFKEMLMPLNLKGELLTSSIKGKKRDLIYEMVKSGELDYLVGTHALLNEKIIFDKLGLIITDEQHRFGVNQRNTLEQKGTEVDILLMSATPIPRSLAMTLYSNHEISTIKVLPSERKKVATFIIKDDFEKIREIILKKIERGEQIYIVCALIEESDTNIYDVETVAKKLVNVKANFKVVHGKMKYEEKDKIFQDFYDKKIDVLISTTVIEVGIDVSSATTIFILNAERFGLAQLHQLRGRVGRSNLQSECYLVSRHQTERLEIIVNNHDGFKISESDLKLRGPGQFFGTLQSGQKLFKLLNINDDYTLLKCAKEDVYKNKKTI